MGLDIVFASQLKATDAENEEAQHLVNISDFRERGDGIVEGYYLLPKARWFRAGSYGTYNSWRESLSLLANGVLPQIVWRDPFTYAEKPFYELIDFTDCEGFIGPNTSAKLARDFEIHKKAFVIAAKGWEVQIYKDFAKAFKTAARGGVVVFT